MSQRINAVGIPWYTRQDYPRILQIMADRDRLPATYEAWRKKADDLKRDTERRGIQVIDAIIDPDQFLVWCAAHGLNVDAEARMAFANEAAAEAVRKRH